MELEAERIDFVVNIKANIFQCKNRSIALL